MRARYHAITKFMLGRMLGMGPGRPSITHMPKIAKPLSAIEVSRLRAPGHVPVGGVPGLALQITPTGSRSWTLRAKIGSKRCDLGLGAYPGVSLAQARQQAAAMREQIAAGGQRASARRAGRQADVSPGRRAVY
ncbi:Arm DNA-binding domain-containing protein [Hydrogenophaga borbori]|uniref:Arm DNA-binding domain-containing protein n=1 Tax=Hydrogenophaga borbori TaxID=2294117 RepID=UPI003B01290A